MEMYLKNLLTSEQSLLDSDSLRMNQDFWIIVKYLRYIDGVLQSTFIYEVTDI